MKYELTKKHLVHMVMGVDPSYEHMDERYGSYSGSYDRWTWDEHRLNKLTEKELWMIYGEIS